MSPTFFPTPTAFRTWLTRHGGRATELWVGFHKKASGLGGMTYQEAVDEALCHGWIDGVIKKLDDTSYMHRFSPRRPKSHWSAVNVAKATRLVAAGRMTAAGLAAFRGHESRKAPYSHEAAPRELTRAQLSALRAEPEAWAFFRTQAPHYRKAVANWLHQAKREETRDRRLQLLVSCSAEGRRIPQFLSPAPTLKR